jgi:hypothetical protein
LKPGGSSSTILQAKPDLELNKGTEKKGKFWRQHGDNQFLWVKTSIYGACRASNPGTTKPAEQFTEIARAVPYEELCAQRCAREPNCKGYEYSQWQSGKCEEETPRKSGGKCEIHWVAPDGKEPDFNPSFSCYRKLDFKSDEDTNELKSWHGRDDTNNYKAMCNYFCDQFLEDVIPEAADKPDSCEIAHSKPKTLLWLMINAHLLPEFDYAVCLASPNYLYTKGFIKCWGTKCETYLKNNGISKAVDRKKQEKQRLQRAWNAYMNSWKK